MVHGIRMLKCDEGHILPIQFDSNECGCHDEGRPCIVFFCHECNQQIYIPLGAEGVKVVKSLILTGKDIPELNKKIKKEVENGKN